MLKKYLTVFFVSMVPLIELRGAIPYGVIFGLPLWSTYIIAIIGNMIPVPFIFLFARKILEWGADKPVIGKFFTFCLEKRPQGRPKAESHRRPRPFYCSAAVCGHSPARHRRMDRHPGRQPTGYGFQGKRSGLHGRRSAGRLHYGRTEHFGHFRFWCNRRLIFSLIVYDKKQPRGCFLLLFYWAVSSCLLNRMRSLSNRRPTFLAN